MFAPVDTYTVARPLKIKGVSYTPGQEIDAAIVASIRGADGLLSRKFIIPTPDPHGRKTLPEKPTPISTPATYRKRTKAAPPTALALSPTGTQKIVAGGSVQFSVVPTPAGANKSVVWSSDDSTIVSVTQSGKATGKKFGSTSVRAKNVDDDSITASSTVNCQPTALEITTVAPKCAVAGTVQLDYTLTPKGVWGGTVPITWTSGAPATATVSATGLVTGVAAGTAVMTCKLAQDATISDTVTVTVTAVFGDEEQQQQQKPETDVRRVGRRKKTEE